jgi:hypothetical protein
MSFPVPALHLKLVAAPPTIVHDSSREDVLWNRPVFTAPPLTPLLPVLISYDLGGEYGRQPPTAAKLPAA